MQLLAISNWWFNSVWQWSCCHVCIHWYHRSHSHLQYHLDQMSTYINSKVRKQGTQLLHKNPTRDGMYAILCHCHHSKNKRLLYVIIIQTGGGFCQSTVLTPPILSIKKKSVDSVAERRRTAISRLSLQESLAMFGLNMFQHVMYINH